MITRKEFIIGAGSMAATASAMTCASIGGVSGRARGLMGGAFMGALMAQKSGPAARDYVQDGLIAMWDGIENAGWNRHNPNATTWLDLVGGINVQIQNTTVHDNHISFTGTHSAVGSYLNKYFGNNKDFSVEAVYDRGSSAGAEYCGPFYVGYQLVNLYKVISGKVTVGNRNSYASTPNSIVGHSVSSYVVNAASGRVFGFVNGTNILDRTSSILGDSPRGNSSTYIGGSLYDLPVDVYSIRIYSRAISTSEVAANYAVDKARFGLS